MKKIILIVMSCMNLMLHSELLVVVKEGEKFRALTQAESIQYQKKINAVKEKYQWPMCAKEDLTSEEIAEYLQEGKPYAEEQFVQKKLRQAIDPTVIDLQILFVPTSIYELYCLSENQFSSFSKHHISLDGLNLNDASKSKLTVQQEYTNLNNTFTQARYGESIASAVNRNLSEYILNTYPELQNQPNILKASNLLRTNIESLKDTLCSKIEEQGSTLRNKVSELIFGPKIKRAYIQNEPKTRIISKVIQLEYEARELNKSLLLRGTTLIPNSVDFKKDAKKSVKLAGSTRLGKESFMDIVLESGDNPYSISFGDSLFAGILHDPGACAYYYLNGQVEGENQDHLLGYGLLIDRQNYIKNNNNGLFFIPTLSSLASLSAEGELFHPRTRAALPNKSSKNIVTGIASEGLLDPANIIIFNGNPIHQAEKFSRFLAKHGRMIQSGDEANLTPEEKNAVLEITQAQRAAAQSYQTLRVLGTKTLRLLYRAGSTMIPGISEIELASILENGPTAQQFEALQNGLEIMQLEPVTKEFFKMSPQKLYDKIIANRLDPLLKKNIEELENLSPQDFAVTLKMIQLASKNILTLNTSTITNKVIPFLEKGMSNSSENIRLLTINCLQNLIQNKSIIIDQAMPLLEKAIDCLNENVQFHALDCLETLIKDKSITADQAMPLLEKSISSSNENVQFHALDRLQTLIENKSIRTDQVIPLLEKSINSSDENVQHQTIYCLQTLIENKSITADQAMPLLKQGIDSSSQNVQRSGMNCLETLIKNESITTRQFAQIFSTIIKAHASLFLVSHLSDSDLFLPNLVDQRLLTSYQIKELIVVAPEYTTYLENLLKKAQALEPAVTHKGMLSRIQNIFRPTLVSLMRHEPSDLTKYELERVGITPKQERIALQERIAPYQDFGINPAQQFDLEQQREQLLEHRQQMPEGPFYQAGQLTDVAPLIGVAGRLPKPQQQRIIMQQPYRLPTAAELRRTGVNVAKGVIRKK